MIPFAHMPARELLERHIHPSDKPATRMGSVLRAQNYYGYYWQIGRAHRPKSILEIGVRFGYSAICLIDGAGTNPDYFGIDHEHFPGSNAYAHEHIKEHTKGRVMILNKTSQEVSTSMLPCRFDLAHVDAGHTYTKVMADLDLAGARLRPGGLIVVDDAKVHGVYKAAMQWAAKRHFAVQAVESMQGTVLIWKRSLGDCSGAWLS